MHRDTVIIRKEANNKVSPAFSKAAVSKGRAFGRAPQSANPSCLKKRRGFRDPRRGSLPHHHSRLLCQQKPTIIFCCPIRRCVKWFTFTSVRLSGCEMGEVFIDAGCVSIFLSDFKMFPLRYNFSLRFLMWKTKGGNPKGLGGVPPLSIPPRPRINNKVSPAFSKGAGVQRTPLRSRSADRAGRGTPRINNKVSPAFSKAAGSMGARGVQRTPLRSRSADRAGRREQVAKWENFLFITARYP